MMISNHNLQDCTLQRNEKGKYTPGNIMDISLYTECRVCFKERLIIIKSQYPTNYVYW